MKQFWQWCLLCILLGGQAIAPAQPSPSDATPTTLSEAGLRGQLMFNEAQELVDKSARMAACRQLLEPWVDEARRAYRSVDDRFPFVLSGCIHSAAGNDRPKVTADEVRQWLEPWRALLRQQGEPDRLLDIKWAVAVQRHLGVIGLPEDAAEMFFGEVRQRVDRWQAAPGDPLVADELTFVARTFFGAWQHQDMIRRVHGLLERGLGAGHRISLSVLRSMAYHERFMGRPAQALAYIERAVALTREHHPDDAVLGAQMATEHAASLSSAGRLAEARQRMVQAREVFAAQVPVQDINLIRIDYNLAEMALDMSDFHAAVAYADASIERARNSGQPLMLVEARVPRATREVARLHLGEADAAARLKEVLDETLAAEMHIGSQAFALVEHAAQRNDRALLDWAVEFNDLHIRRFRAPMQSDAALRPLMQAWQASGYALQAPQARPLLDRALAISLAGRSQGTLALTQFNLARHLARDEPDTALWLYKRGANALQRMRSGLPAGEPELHRAWLGVHESDLRHFIGLLIDQGRLVEAEQALTLLRDEESHEFSRRSARSRGGTTQSLSYTSVEVSRNAAMDATARSAEQAAVAADARVEAKGSDALRTNYKDAQAQSDIDELASQVHRVVDEAPAGARGLPGPRAQPVALRAGVARLVYFVRDQGVDIVLQYGRTRQRITVPVSRVDLNRVIQSARAALGTPQIDAMPALQALHRWLVAPLAVALRQAGVREIQWVPDAALRYVPFGALHDGRRHVAEQFVVTTRWSGSSAQAADDPAADIASQTAPKHQGGILAMGRTVGDATHGALPGVREEIGTVRAAGGQGWLDADFTEPRLREALAHGPDVVHLASHFNLDPAGEEKSYLLLGDGTRLSLSALAALPWRGVKLALLSACDSGVSFESGPGQALVGFASSLQRAGAANVLATLWRVSDGATARWIDMFYRGGATVAKSRHAPALDATRATKAQRQWIRQFAGTPLGHPHYWAGFTWLARD